MPETVITRSDMISGLAPSCFGPFQNSSGNHYVVTLDGITSRFFPKVWKAGTDPTGSWTEQDVSSKPNVASDAGTNPWTAGIWCFQNGDILHIAGGMNGADIRYLRFDMLNDQYQDINGSGLRVVVVQEIGATAGPHCHGIISNAAGNVITIINQQDNSTNKDMGSAFEWVGYARSTDSGQTWSAGNALWNVAVTGNGQHWRGGFVMRGASDRAHFLVKEDSNDAAYQRTLTSANSLQAVGSYWQLNVCSVTREIYGEQYTVLSGDNMRFTFVDSGHQQSIGGFQSTDTPSPTRVAAGVNSNNVDHTSEWAVQGIGRFGQQQYSFYAERSGGAQRDIHYNVASTPDTWGTETFVSSKHVLHIHPARTAFQVNGVDAVPFVWNDTISGNVGDVVFDYISLGSPTIDIDAAATVIAITSAQTLVDRKLVASSVVEVVASAETKRDRKIDASAVADVSTALELAMSRELAASATAIAIANAELGKNINLDASAVVVAISSADTLVSRELSATSTAVVSASAETSLSRLISAAATVVASSSAQLANSRALSASATAVVQAAAELAITSGAQIDIDAATAVAIVAAAELAVQRDLDAATINTVVAASETLMSRKIDGATTVVVPSAAELIATKGLYADSTVVVPASAETLLNRKLDGAADVEVPTSAQTLVNRKLDGAAAVEVPADTFLGLSRKIDASATVVVPAAAELAVTALNLVNLDGSTTVVVGAAASLAVMKALAATANNVVAASAVIDMVRDLDAETIASASGQAFLALARDLAAEGKNIVPASAALARSIKINVTANNIVIAAAELAVSLPAPVVGANSSLEDAPLYFSALTDGMIIFPTLNDQSLYTSVLADGFA